MVMGVVKVTRNFQVSIPKDIRDQLGIEEGDLVEVSEQDGRIVMVPKRLIDADQAWFWTKEWQEKEREADEEIRKGLMEGPFDTVDDLMKHLDS
jgi:AbrB family looped-hinge helix DNA binding protein